MNDQLVAENQEHLRLQAGGALNPRRHLYIERPDDQTLLNLLSEGQYVNVLTSRQMGKSSLMVRTAAALTKRGVKCAILDLAAELGTPENATAYFLGLLSKIARDLKIKVDLPTWWAERPEETVNQRLIRFFREVVLEQVPGPVVCFLDEIDSTLKLPWTDDLFTALRGMHNERPIVPAYERLTFCLIGVAWPNELIKDRRTTPYNVGRTLELRDFDLARDDLTPLIDALGADPEQGSRLIERVLHWTGGHPYLTARLCASLKEIGARAPEDVDRRVDDGFRSLERVSADVHFQQVVRFLETRVANGLATLGLYEKILKGARERDQPAPAHTELKLSGLVKRDEEGCLVVRNRIYERLFDRRWVESTKPKRDLARTRRGAIAASVALLVAIGAGGAYYATVVRPEQQRLAALDALADRNITVTSAEGRGGIRIVFPVDTSQAVFETAAPLLKAIGPVTELSLRTSKVTGRNTRVANVGLLTSLTGLRSLDLAGTHVKETAPLANLTNLESLTLSGTPVRDLTHVANLTKLQQLDLDATEVTDLGHLATLTNLQKLNLSNTQVEEIGPLADLKSLKELDLTATRVYDLAVLDNLTNLERLNLVRTRVSDLRPIRNLRSLKWIDIAGTDVTDLSPLETLTKLEYLGIGGGSRQLDQSYDYMLGRLSTIPRTERGAAAPIAAFDVLGDLTGLVWLDLYQSDISDLTPIKTLQNIVGLSLGETSVGDVSPLSDLKTLKTLNLRSTNVENLAPLAGLTNLQTLNLGDTPVADLAPLAGLTNLQWLDLAGTQIADAAPLADLTRLQWLDLSRTRISHEQVIELKRTFAERGNRSVQIIGP